MPRRPCLPTGTHHGVLYPSGAITVHFGGDSAVAPDGSVPSADATVSLVLWGPRAHPSWTSRNPSIRSCGRSKLSGMKQRQLLPRPLLLLTSCQSLRWMARCCHQHPLTSPSTFFRTAGVGHVPCSVQYLSWTVRAHRPVALAWYWMDLSHSQLTARVDWMLIQRQDLANSLCERIM